MSKTNPMLVIKMSIYIASSTKVWGWGQAEIIITHILHTKKAEECNKYCDITVKNNAKMSRLFERVMYNHLVHFLDLNGILYQYQVGFRQGHSTQQAIINVVEKINSSVFYLKKAFDTVYHQILQKKKLYDIRGNILQWFESYLSDRSQYVTYDGMQSKALPIKCGVPQGSILGPLLFIIYMKDICNVSDLLYTILYADDTSVLLKGKNI